MRELLDRTDAALHRTLDKCDDALSRLETWIAWQRPATHAWTPVTDYSFEARRPLEEPQAKLLLDVFRPSRVLDVGAGPGHLVRLLRDLDKDVTVIGLDSSYPLSYGTWRQPPNCYRFDIVTDDGSDEEDSTDPADLVICREVLEHLTLLQVRKAVTNLCALSTRFVYVTTRFAQGWGPLAFDTSDDLDPTHITLLSKDFLRLLFVLEGFKRRADLERDMDWMQKGRVLVYERAA